MFIFPFGFHSAIDAGSGGASAADFNGVDDFYNRVTDLSGNAIGKKGICSFWFMFDGSDGVQQMIIKSTSSRFLIVKDPPSNKFRIKGARGDGLLVLDLRTVSAYTADSTWHHFLCSWDISGSGNSNLFIDDSDDLNEVSVSVGQNIDYTNSEWWFGASSDTPTLELDAKISEFYLNLTQTLDFSAVGNRRKFISSSSIAVDLGSDGSTPTGTQPIVFFSAGFPDNNLGSGGDFTVQNAADAVAGPNP